MFPKDLAQICVMYALTPLHAGAGQAIGAVDLPIQRERHTQWPHVQASGVKGAFRDWFQRYYLATGVACRDMEIQAEQLTRRVFGQEEGGGDGVDKGGQAGAISVTDARLLAFPVRSNVAPFVWVVCPALLKRLRRDLKICQINDTIPEIALPNEDSYIPICGPNTGSVILEDLAVKPEKPDDKAINLGKTFNKLAPQVERLLLISDQNFSFLVQNATEVQPQISIDFETGTTKTGSLRYQELLPADTALYTFVFYAQERVVKKDNLLIAKVIQECVNAAIKDHIQMGGDMTLGRGLLQVKWIPSNSKESTHE
ncbi:MAG TPA: type III-B CRISPR module RAMP protein Cmr4 [Desulfobacterales bacterium]|nr:type III-B CRISPR module RAMP protein Cmr4 [Desulfobacterales bacterium]